MFGWAMLSAFLKSQIEVRRFPAALTTVAWDPPIANHFKKMRSHFLANQIANVEGRSKWIYNTLPTTVKLPPVAVFTATQNKLIQSKASTKGNFIYHLAHEQLILCHRRLEHWATLSISWCRKCSFINIFLYLQFQSW